MPTHPPAPSGAPGGDPDGWPSTSSPADPDRSDRSDTGSPAPLDPAVVDVLLHPGWRARWDDLTGGWGASPVAVGLGVVVAVGVVVVLLGWAPGSSATSGPSTLPMVDAAAGPEGGMKAGGGTTVSAVAGAAVAPEAGPVSPVATVGPATTVMVHAAGAVARPGLYTLPSGARVDDLVAAAGGATADADLDRVNLAAPLVDGTRVHVPRRGEDPPVEVSVVGGAAAVASSGEAGDGGAPALPVSLSTASRSDLEALPGIGPATATAILEHRDRVGGFATVDELLDVRGIGEARLEQLRPLVVP